MLPQYQAGKHPAVKVAWSLVLLQKQGRLHPDIHEAHAVVADPADQHYIWGVSQDWKLLKLRVKDWGGGWQRFVGWKCWNSSLSIFRQRECLHEMCREASQRHIFDDWSGKVSSLYVVLPLGWWFLVLQEVRLNKSVSSIPLWSGHQFLPLGS